MSDTVEELKEDDASYDYEYFVMNVVSEELAEELKKLKEQCERYNHNFLEVIGDIV